MTTAKKHARSRTGKWSAKLKPTMGVSELQKKLEKTPGMREAILDERRKRRDAQQRQCAKVAAGEYAPSDSPPECFNGETEKRKATASALSSPTLAKSRSPRIKYVDLDRLPCRSLQLKVGDFVVLVRSSLISQVKFRSPEDWSICGRWSMGEDFSESVHNGQPEGTIVFGVRCVYGRGHGEVEVDYKYENRWGDYSLKRGPRNAHFRYTVR